MNIFLREFSKGNKGKNTSGSIFEGSFGTRNVNLSFDGNEDKFDYFFGLTNFSSDGISAHFFLRNLNPNNIIYG